MTGKEQYATSDKYEARIFLNAKYSTNKESKFKWAFGHFPKKGNLKVLELGCGTGLFWLANRNEIPSGWEITLTDTSGGMISKTRETLSAVKHNLIFEVASAENFNYPTGYFDVILANNMLYHVDKRREAIASIAKALKKDGVFIASTTGKNDMKELNERLYDFLSSRDNRFRFGGLPFSLDNGAAQLKRSFAEVDTVLFNNSLEITDIEPVINYYLSFNGMHDGLEILRPVDLPLFRITLHNYLNAKKMIKVTKESGLFICRKPVLSAA